MIRALFAILIFLLFTGHVMSAEVRIMSQGVEDSYTTHPLEAQWGSGAQSYLDLFIARATRVSGGHSGSYAIQYNAYVGAPNAVLGYTSSLLNTDEFYLPEYDSGKWFFRYWFKSSPTAANNHGGMTTKHIYINYANGESTIGDFVLASSIYSNGAGESSGFHVTWHQGKNYATWALNIYFNFSDIFDGEWHEIEYFIDVGSGNGATDAALKIWVDGTSVYSNNAVLSSASAISDSPLIYMYWPGSNNAEDAVGDVIYQLDDFEIFADVTGSGEAATGSMADGTIEASTDSTTITVPDTKLTMSGAFSIH